MQAKENKGGGGADMEKEMSASAWGREEHYLFLKALQQHGDARKTMPANEWLQKIADAVGTRTLDETREHIQEYFQATNHEGLMPASLMSMHEQQYNSQPVQIIHPNAIMECAMPLPIQQPPRLSPACFARIKAQQHTLLGSYCAASEWTREEQIVLEEGLKRFPASQYNNLTRYIKIAAFLPDKTITDVAKRYKWMVELQRLNSINFSDDHDGRQSELPASPSESCTLQHPATGGHFAPTGEKLNPEAAEKLKAKSTTEPEKVLAASLDRPPHTGQETVTSEAGVRRLLNENDSLIKAVKEELGSSAGTGNAKSLLLAKDGGAMEKMIRFRSNLSNVLNCLAMSSGCMSKMPPLLVKLHPLPFIEALTVNTDTVPDSSDTKALAGTNNGPSLNNPSVKPSTKQASEATDVGKESGNSSVASDERPADANDSAAAKPEAAAAASMDASQVVKLEPPVVTGMKSEGTNALGPKDLKQKTIEDDQKGKKVVQTGKKREPEPLDEEPQKRTTRAKSSPGKAQQDRRASSRQTKRKRAR